MSIILWIIGGLFLWNLLYVVSKIHIGVNGRLKTKTCKGRIIDIDKGEQ